MSGRPTVVVQRVDVSTSDSRASAARSIREGELAFGYSGLAISRLETLPCACGGEVTADPERPAPGVAAHQFTGRHKGWRSARGLDV